MHKSHQAAIVCIQRGSWRSWADPVHRRRRHRIERTGEGDQGRGGRRVDRGGSANSPGDCLPDAGASMAVASGVSGARFIGSTALRPNASWAGRCVQELCRCAAWVARTKRQVCL